MVPLGPLTSPNLNISTIWVRDPWVAIQINLWGSLLSTTEVLHTCKKVNYFYLPIYFSQGWAPIVREWFAESELGVGANQVGSERWGKGGGVRGGNRGGMYILIKFSVKQLEH